MVFKTNTSCRLSICILLLTALLPVYAEIYTHPDYGYSVDLPEGWKIYDKSDQQTVSFLSADKSLAFQIMCFKPESYYSSVFMRKDFQRMLKTKGNAIDFTYNNTDASFCEWSFPTQQTSSQGCFFFINAEKYDYYIAAFCPADRFETAKDQLFSAIDSFRTDVQSVYKPGCVSQALYQGQQSAFQSYSFSFLDQNCTATIDKNAKKANQMVIEREYRILTAYLNERSLYAAWQRYYRVIFQDTYEKLEPIYKIIQQKLNSDDSQKISLVLLKWFQSFAYSRQNTPSDLLSPLTAIVSQNGDCDSRCIAYTVLLRWYSIRSILMVSGKHSHSIAGLDIPGKGARFSWEGTAYLVAELTKKIDLGLIAQDMADPKDWFGVVF